MLYTEKEKKEIERVRGVCRLHPGKPVSGMFWSDKWAICWLKIGARTRYIAENG